MSLSMDSQTCVDFVKRNLYPYKKQHNITHIYTTINKILVNTTINLDLPLCYNKKNKIINTRGNIYWILKQLIHYNTNLIDNEIKEYLNNSNCLQDKECISWLDNKGHHKLQDIYQLMKSQHLPKNMSNILNQIYPKEIYQDIYSKFTSVNIQNNIEKNLHYINIYQYSNIKIIAIKDSLDSIYNYIKQLIIFIMVMLSFTNNQNKTIEIKIFLTDAKKKINPNYKYLGIDEVNTGSTYRGDCSSVLIWRKEEAYKVILHELCHCLSFDFELPDNLEIKIRDMFPQIPKNNEIRVYEAYVEMWGLIIHMNLLSSKLNINIDEIYLHECCFSLIQVAKILKHFGFTNWNQFYNNTNYKSNYQQRSSILSYYIIKTSFLFNLDYFLKWCQTNNLEYPYINFNNSSKTIYHSYINLIQYCCDDILFQNNINYYLTNSNLFENNDFLKNTLRMSCYELSI